MSNENDRKSKKEKSNRLFSRRTDRIREGVCLCCGCDSKVVGELDEQGYCEECLNEQMGYLKHGIDEQ